MHVSCAGARLRRSWRVNRGRMQKLGNTGTRGETKNRCVLMVSVFHFCTCSFSTSHSPSFQMKKWRQGVHQLPQPPLQYQVIHVSQGSWSVYFVELLCVGCSVGSYYDVFSYSLSHCCLILSHFISCVSRMIYQSRPLGAAGIQAAE